MKRSWKGETFWKLVWHQRTLFIVTLYLRKYNLLLLLLFSGHQWYISSANVIHLKPCSCCYLIYIFFVWWVSVLQRRLKMDWRWMRRFFSFLKWTEDEYEESSLIQKFFEDLRRYKDFQRKMKNFCY